MAEAGGRRRLAVVAAVSAAAVGVAATVAVLVANASTGDDAAAPVASAAEYPPLESDVLSEEQARARDRAIRQAENARARGLLAPDVRPEDLVAPDGSASVITTEGRDIDCTQVKCVAITFDDGPGSQTDELLRMLSAVDALATWFPLGAVVADSPDRLRAIADAGHEIGNHSWSHPQLTARSNGEIDTQVTRTAELIEELLGTRPSLVRPPYGAISRRVVAELGRLNAPAILWDVDSRDWATRNATSVRRAVLRQVRPGSIVLLHDIHPSTIAAMPRILRTLAARDYVFVTVSELFGGELKAGQVYLDRTDQYRGF